MKRVLLLSVACVLGACAGPRPDAPLSAKVPPPAGWRDASATPAPVNIDWWRRFNDPVLTQLVETALANNTDIAQATARVDEARYGYQAAEGALWPSLSLSAGGAYQRSISQVTGRPVRELLTGSGLEVD